MINQIWQSLWIFLKRLSLNLVKINCNLCRVFSYNLIYTETMIQIQHSFQTKAHDLKALFEKTNKMSTFMRKLDKQAEIDPDRYDRDKYCGDGFEFFVELFLKLCPTDNRVGVYNYEPTQENDNGVDGIGINIRGEKSVVQIKYRSNSESVLTATQDHLAHLISDGMLAHDVISDKVDVKNFRHFIFTTAEGLHYYTDDEFFKSRVKCFAYQDFRQMLDNNIVFWDAAREIVANL